MLGKCVSAQGSNDDVSIIQARNLPQVCFQVNLIEISNNVAGGAQHGSRAPKWNKTISWRWMEAIIRELKLQYQIIKTESIRLRSDVASDGLVFTIDAKRWLHWHVQLVSFRIWTDNIYIDIVYVFAIVCRSRLCMLQLCKRTNAIPLQISSGTPFFFYSHSSQAERNPLPINNVNEIRRVGLTVSIDFVMRWRWYYYSCEVESGQIKIESFEF